MVWFLGLLRNITGQSMAAWQERIWDPLQTGTLFTPPCCPPNLGCSTECVAFREFWRPRLQTGGKSMREVRNQVFKIWYVGYLSDTAGEAASICVGDYFSTPLYSPYNYQQPSSLSPSVWFLLSSFAEHIKHNSGMYLLFSIQFPHEVCESCFANGWHYHECTSSFLRKVKTRKSCNWDAPELQNNQVKSQLLVLEADDVKSFITGTVGLCSQSHLAVMVVLTWALPLFQCPEAPECRHGTWLMGFMAKARMAKVFQSTAWHYP